MDNNNSSELNASAFRVIKAAEPNFPEWGVKSTVVGGARVYDFGKCTADAAGLFYANACMSGLGSIAITPHSFGHGLPQRRLTVHSGNPTLACMASQYAGWQYSLEKEWIGMVSGPIRLVLNREGLLQHLGISENPGRFTVGLIERSEAPPERAIADMARQLDIDPVQLVLLVAPMPSPVGMIQVVARGLEVAMHQLCEQAYIHNSTPVRPNWVQYGRATMPLPEPSPHNATAMNNANDAIIKLGQVELDLSQMAAEGRALDDETAWSLGETLISSNYERWKEPFGVLLKEFNYDFSTMGAMFAPAKVTIVNLDTGNRQVFGVRDYDALRASLQTDFQSKK